MISDELILAGKLQLKKLQKKKPEKNFRNFFDCSLPARINSSPHSYSSVRSSSVVNLSTTLCLKSTFDLSESGKDIYRSHRKVKKNTLYKITTTTTTSLEVYKPLKGFINCDLCTIRDFATTKNFLFNIYKLSIWNIQIQTRKFFICINYVRHWFSGPIPLTIFKLFSVYTLALSLWPLTQSQELLCGLIAFIFVFIGKLEQQRFSSFNS